MTKGKWGVSTYNKAGRAHYWIDFQSHPEHHVRSLCGVIEANDLLILNEKEELCRCKQCFKILLNGRGK